MVCLVGRAEPSGARDGEVRAGTGSTESREPAASDAVFAPDAPTTSGGRSHRVTAGSAPPCATAPHTPAFVHAVNRRCAVGADTPNDGGGSTPRTPARQRGEPFTACCPAVTGGQVVAPRLSTQRHTNRDVRSQAGRCMAAGSGCSPGPVWREARGVGDKSVVSSPGSRRVSAAPTIMGSGSPTASGSLLV